MKLSAKAKEALEKLGAERKPRKNLVTHSVKAHAKAMEFDKEFGGLEFTGTNEAGIDGLPLGIPSMELGLHVVKSKWFHKAPDPKGCVGIGRYDAGTELSLYMDAKGKVFVWGWGSPPSKCSGRRAPLTGAAASAARRAAWRCSPTASTAATASSSPARGRATPSATSISATSPRAANIR
jgi:hypothetical protein